MINQRYSSSKRQAWRAYKQGGWLVTCKSAQAACYKHDLGRTWL